MLYEWSTPEKKSIYNKRKIEEYVVLMDRCDISVQIQQDKKLSCCVSLLYRCIFTGNKMFPNTSYNLWSMIGRGFMNQTAYLLRSSLRCNIWLYTCLNIQNTSNQSKMLQ